MAMRGEPAKVVSAEKVVLKPEKGATQTRGGDRGEQAVLRPINNAATQAGLGGSPRPCWLFVLQAEPT